MIDTVQIMTAVHRLAITGIPEQGIPPADGLKAIYFNLTPKDFHRPSLLIQSVDTRQKRASHSLIFSEERLLLTVFDTTDDYSHTDTMGLLELRQKVLDLFRPGCLPVGGRVLRVKASTGGRNWDEAYVDLGVEFYDAVTESGPTEPLMEHIDAAITLQRSE